MDYKIIGETVPVVEVALNTGETMYTQSGGMAYQTEGIEMKTIDEIHKIGGTYLGTSRGGGQRVGEIVDCIERDGINMLFIQTF